MDSLWSAIRTDWHENAACFGTFNPIFMPAVETDALLETVRSLFCDHCPVRAKCLNSALINNDTGFWGGTSTEIRQAMKRKRHRAKCPACLSIRLVIIDEDETDNVSPYEVCLACGASWKGESHPAPATVQEPPTVEAELSCA
jgi:Zn finger protein HypA/HybF involved in hydrogenase expression